MLLLSSLWKPLLHIPKSKAAKRCFLTLKAHITAAIRHSHGFRNPKIHNPTRIQKPSLSSPRSRREMAPKKGAKLPVAAKKKVEKVVNPLFEKRPEQFGIGGALPPKKDLHRFVRWPQVVRIQRKKMILKQRLKVPPPIHQFSKTLDKNLATSLFKVLLRYRPEDRAQKKDRLLKRAQAEAEGKTPETKKPIVVKYGLNHVTYLIEQNKAPAVNGVASNTTLAASISTYGVNKAILLCKEKR